MTKIDIEEMTIEFLRKNDTYFQSTSKHKVKNEDYPYHTPQQVERKARVELPLTCLTKKDSYTCLKKGIDSDLLSLSM